MPEVPGQQPEQKLDPQARIDAKQDSLHLKTEVPEAGKEASDLTDIYIKKVDRIQDILKVRDTDTKEQKDKKLKGQAELADYLDKVAPENMRRLRAETDQEIHHVLIDAGLVMPVNVKEYVAREEAHEIERTKKIVEAPQVMKSAADIYANKINTPGFEAPADLLVKITKLQLLSDRLQLLQAQNKEFQIRNNPFPEPGREPEVNKDLDFEISQINNELSKLGPPEQLYKTLDTQWFEFIKTRVNLWKNFGLTEGFIIRSPITGLDINISNIMNGSEADRASAKYEDCARDNWWEKPEVWKEVVSISGMIIAGIVVGVTTGGFGLGVLSTVAIEAGAFTVYDKTIGSALPELVGKLAGENMFRTTETGELVFKSDDYISALKDPEGWAEGYARNTLMFGAFKGGAKIAGKAFEASLTKLGTEELAAIYTKMEVVAGGRVKLERLLGGKGTEIVTAATSGDAKAVAQITEAMTRLSAKAFLKVPEVMKLQVIDLMTEYATFVSFDSGSLIVDKEWHEGRMPTIEEFIGVAKNAARMMALLKCGNKIASFTRLDKRVAGTLNKYERLKKSVVDYVNTKDPKLLDLAEQQMQEFRDEAGMVKFINDTNVKLSPDSFKGTELSILRQLPEGCIIVDKTGKLKYLSLESSKLGETLRELRPAESEGAEMRVRSEHLISGIISHLRKEWDSQGLNYEQRTEILRLSEGQVASYEIFTRGDLPPGKELDVFMANPDNWMPGRVELHKRLVNAEFEKAKLLSERMGNDQPTIDSLRGNTAAGKTSKLKEEDIFKKAIDEKGGVSGAINPDIFKAGLRAETATADYILTASQAHEESSILAKILMAKIKTEAPELSMIIDKRLDKLKNIQEVLALSKESGKPIRMLDVDAPFETSCQRVLARAVAGVDPIVPFNMIADGFVGVRANREELIKKYVEKEDAFANYVLYVTDATGRSVKVGQKVDGEFRLSDDPRAPQLYEDAVRVKAEDLEKVVAQVGSTIITDEYIKGVSDPGTRLVMERYKGKTIKEALDIQSTLTREPRDAWYYTREGLDNLNNTSRTATGKVDTSASRDKAEKIVDGLTLEGTKKNSYREL